jgi:hypothetical protein
MNTWTTLKSCHEESTALYNDRFNTVSQNTNKNKNILHTGNLMRKIFHQRIKNEQEGTIR